MTKTTMRNYIENIGREMEHQTSTDPLLENFCICFTNHIGCVWVVLCGQNVPVNCFPLFHRDLKTEKRRRGQFRIVHPISRDGRAAQTHTHSHTHCNGHSLDIDETKWKRKSVKKEKKLVFSGFESIFSTPVRHNRETEKWETRVLLIYPSPAQINR